VQLHICDRRGRGVRNDADTRRRSCSLRQRAWRLRHSRKKQSAPVSRHAKPPLFFPARGRRRSFRPAPSFEEGARNAGRTMRPQPRVQDEFWTHEIQSPRKHRIARRSARGGFCGLLRMSPGGRSFDTHRWCGPGGAAFPKEGFADRAMLWREASRREHATWADARSDASRAHLRPGRIAQRGRQPKLRYPQRFPGLERTLCGACVSIRGSRPQDLMLRPDAAASTASRPAYRDDREPPLMSGTG
jgi:hypothetical protein